MPAIRNRHSRSNFTCSLHKLWAHIVHPFGPSLDLRPIPAESMALFVLKNNPAFRFYERHGFEVVRETHTTLVMRRALAEEA